MSVSISENLQRVRERIDKACHASGREPSSVKLIVVTKTHPVEKIQAVVDAGVTWLGENRVQEMLPKIPVVKGPVNWHLVGHLQTNKARKVVGKVGLIHSVDTLHLAQSISRISEEAGLESEILLQVNTSGEESKFGCHPDETMGLARETAALPALRLKGLMTIGNFADNPEDVRPCFRILKRQFEELKTLDLPGATITELSMGMTNDFEVAIEEGATLIRVGTAIFGARG